MNLIRTVVIAAVAALTIPTLAVSPLPAAAAESDPVVSADLADSGPQQQGWISAPGSRLTLNPGNPQFPGLRGSTMPVSTEYFAYGAEGYQDQMLQLFYADGDAPGGDDENEVVTGFEESFDDLTTNEWTFDRVTAATSDGVATVTTSGGDWGKMASKNITVDLSIYSTLTIKIDAVGEGGLGRWALKLQPAGGGGDRTIQPDTPQPGVFEYDLSDLESTSNLAGPTTFSMYFFVSGGDGRFAAVDWIRFSGTPTAEPTDPEEGQDVGFADDFGVESAGAWQRDLSENNGATYESTADGGVVAMPDGGWGAVAQKITIDVDRFPSLSIWTADTSGKWSMKLSENGRDESATLQGDTNRTGVQTFDLTSATGWTGEKTFYVKLYHIGDPGTSTTFSRLSIHTDERWLTAASGYTSTWSPDAISFTADYGSNGSISGFDVPVGVDGFGRIVRAESGSPTIAALGAYRGNAQWNEEASRLTVVSTVGSGSYTWVVQLPEGSSMTFFTSRARAVEGESSSAMPFGGGGYWVAVLPNDDANAVSFGYALGSDSAAASAATAAASAGAGPDQLVAARTHWVAHYDDFLAQVPVPADFSLPGIETEGVTPEQIERLYYTAYVGLEANIMAPTPETEGAYWQIATGKPSTYASGPRGAEASAEWDSLFGMQFMSHIRPEIAWSAFMGNLEHAVPEPGTSHETLPSRKAQTAWILYQVTGDLEALTDSYGQLEAYLDWASQESNMKWSYSGKGDGERDAEFFVSMIIDLGYGQQIARLLGNEGKADEWAATAESLAATYEDYFFPGDGVALYKHWIDGEHEDIPGRAHVVGTGLHVSNLNVDIIGQLKSLFLSVFDPAAPFAGLTDKGTVEVKAPNIQYIGYGLLDQGMYVEAEQMINLMTRDIARAGVFSEVYFESSSGPRGGSVAPSIFGNIHFIDNLWLKNGVRMDLGEPAFVRLPSTTGGVSGLKYLGVPYTVDVVDARFEVSGEAVNTGLLPDGPFQAPPGETVLPSSQDGPTDPSVPIVGLNAFSVARGERLEVHITGLAPQEGAELWMHSSPVLVANISANDEGVATASLTVPADAELGEHRLELRATSSANAWSDFFTVTLAPSDGETEEVPTSSDEEVTPTTDSNDDLPVSGAEVGGLVFIAIMLTGAGLWIARRRTLITAGDAARISDE